MKFLRLIFLSNILVLFGYCSLAGAYGNAVTTWDNTVSPPRESFVAMGGVDPGLGGQSGMTVTAWVRWLGDQSAADDWANIISNNAHNASDNGQFWLQHDDANERFEFAVRGGGRSYVYSTTQPQVGVWYHVAGVYDSTLSGNTLATRRVKIYVNGILEASNNNVSGTITAWVNTYFLNIGRWAYTSERRFEGDIDEVSLWNRALSETEIRDLMTKKLAASEAGLMGYWPLDEASGDLAADLSPSGRNGRVYGETGTVTSGTGTTLIDSSKTWTLDQWAGHQVFILNNTGVGQLRDIVSNTATTLTVSPAWTTNPALNSRYAISAFDRWVCSDAPVGDESVYDYTIASGDTVAFTDAPEIFEAQNITGTILPKAVHIYRVNQPPNFTTSTSPDILNFDISPYYWGVHVIGGTDPDYTVHYTYTGHPQITVSTDENDLILAHRAANCTTPWTDLAATLNTGMDTLSQTTQNGGEYILGVPMGSATDFIVYKTVTDENGGNPETGDILLYTIVIQKPNAANLANAVFTDATPAGTTYVTGSATAPIGSTIVTEDPLSITGIDVPDHGQVTITFRVTITGGSGTTISNQGDLYYDSNADGSNDTHQLSNAAAVTVAAPSTPNFDQTVKSVDLIDDLNLNGAINAGDTLRYTVKICNTGDADAIGVSFSDSIPANTSYVSGSATASSGVIVDNNPTGPITWSGNVSAGMLKCVTITFDVTVDGAVPDGTVISNQGTVTYGADTIDTDGDPFLPGKQATDVIVATMPRGVAVKNVTDENGGNVEAGDYLLYTIEFDNFTTVDVNGLVLTDAIPNNTAYVAGSATVPTGCVIASETPVLVISNIDMPGHSKKTFTFRVQVDNPLPSGVNQILNQGTVFYDSDGDGTNDATQLTDGDTSQYGNQPTIIAVHGGPNFDQTTKSVGLFDDDDSNGVVTPGDTLRYNIKIKNTGTTNATGVVFHDTLPPHTSFDSIVSGGAYYFGTGNQIEWTGNVAAGAEHVIEFDVITGTVPLQTVISNQGIVYYASDGSAPNDSTMLTDGDLTDPGRQTTDVSIGGFPHAYGLKTVTEVNGAAYVSGDPVEPGDRVEYTIYIENTSGFDGNGVELWDPIPNNATYVFGSATYDYGTFSYSSGNNQIEWTGSILANSDLTITFKVDLANPMPAGVIEISNQATAFYDSNTDGVNDTYQKTDGNPNLVGNQPTVLELSAGTISGTVFDDLNEDGGFDTGEPGIPGVAVDLYDAAYALLYGTFTDIDGYYEFTGLPAGDYTVEETNLPYYVSTLPSTPDPSSVDITLASGGSETVNFGDHPNGYADLSITQTCLTVCADRTDQLAYVITVTNDGPNTADATELNDNFTSLISAGLSSIEYSLNGDPREAWPAWPTPLELGDMAPDDTHEILIFATVGSDFEPDENTATVASDIFDPDVEDNAATCTNEICTLGRSRSALEFTPGATDSVSVASSPSIELTANGTLEAWIYPTAFTEDAGILIKGTTNACYGMGLGGGTVFSEGTSQNIGFVIYDDTGGKHLVTTDSATHTLSAYEWQHVACTWSTTASNIEALIYINGILKASETFDFTSNNVRSNTEELIIGYQGITAESFTGVIDDVRVWDTARSQARIQNTMCHKVTDSETDYTNLMAYWRFDEENDKYCNDSSAFYNLGITDALRVCSTAPIGDASAHDDYSGTTPAEFEAELQFGTLDKMTLTGEDGTWNSSEDSCLHVYRVDAPTDYTEAPLFWRSFANEPRYWGAFVSGGTDPTYTAKYEYAGYPNIGNEEGLHLAYRDKNCESWKDAKADLDTDDDTLILNGLSGTEFILGQSMDPRNAIVYDGSNDYVSIPDDSIFDFGSTGTLEAWIYITTFQTNAGIIFKGDGSDGYLLGTDGSTGDNIYFSLYESSGSTSDSVTSATSLKTDIWYHVAATWDGTDMNLYINGVLDSNSKAASQDAGDTSGNPLYIATDGSNFFQGMIDEVRVWDEARDQTDIRDTMCQKLSGSETGLVGYWRFDEETSSITTPDYVFGTGNDGTMNGFGADGDDAIRDARVCSSAPIGDDSSYTYYDSGAVSSISAQLAHSDGDYLFATEYAGSWTGTFSGLQIYRLDEAPVYPPDLWEDTYYDYKTPNGLTPPYDFATAPPSWTWSSIDYYRYWGVFATDWATGANEPTYDVIYNYNGNPSVPANADGTAGNPELGLAYRPTYCFGTWTDSTAYWAFGTFQLELTGANSKEQSQNSPAKTNPEYILGGINQPLAIALASFYAEFDRSTDCIKITWKTATELDTIGFQLWRSDTKAGPYTLIPGSFIASQSVSETTGAEYSYSDYDADLDTYMTFYYKLEEIDLDTARNNPIYGPIGPVTETVGASQFDRNTANTKSGGGCFIDALE